MDRARVDAVAPRLTLLHDVRASVLPGGVLACSDLYRGIARQLVFDPEAAAGEWPRTITALDQVLRGTVVVGDQLYGVGTCFAALSARGLVGVYRRHACPSWRWGQDRQKTPLAGGGLVGDGGGAPWHGGQPTAIPAVASVAQRAHGPRTAGPYAGADPPASRRGPGVVSVARESGAAVL